MEEHRPSGDADNCRDGVGRGGNYGERDCTRKGATAMVGADEVRNEFQRFHGISPLFSKR